MNADALPDTPDNSPAAANPIALLIPDTEAAALCGCSRSHWHTLAAAGKIPPSVKLGRKRLWRREEIIAWIDSDCPDGRTWEAMKAAAGRRMKVVG